MSRYQRQIQVSEIGEAGQQRLAKANVLVVGAGGLGCPVLATLAGAGVGRLVIIDHDRIEASNLHRQPLYTMGDVGRLKAEAARERLLAYNPEIEIDIHAEKLTPQNAAAFVRDCDLAIDAADSFAVTYTLSDACMVQKKHLVSASVLGLSGYAGLFCGNGPSYRAVFPDMPAQAGSCATAGVIGSAVAILGSLQAHLALHTLLQLAPPRYQLISFDGKALGLDAFDFSQAAEPLQIMPFIAPSQVTAEDIVVDLRSLQETPENPFAKSLRILPHEIEAKAAAFTSGARVVLCCRSGIRSAQAARKLQALGVENVALVALGDVNNGAAS